MADLIATNEAEVKTGPFGTQLKASDYVHHGTPVINVRNIGFGKTRDDKLEYIDDTTVHRLSTHILRTGDIVFGRKGAVERHALISPREDGWFQGSDCLRLRLASKRVLPTFLSYYLLTHEHKEWMIQQCSHGATMASLNQDIVGRIVFPAPDIHTQRRIASILSAYDDLIENNTRRMAILEEMARRIYEEWFVRFRFPGHEKVRMIESELGPVPEGWRQAALGSVADIQWGDTSKTKSSYSEIGFDAYSASGLDGQMSTFDYERTGIVLSAIGARCGLTWFARGKWSCIKNTIRFWSLDRQVVSDEFLYLATRDMAYWPRRGAAQPFISLGDAKKCSIILPGNELMSRFGELSQPAMELVSVLSKMNRTLRSARDLLLPKLVSGELDVSNLPEPEAAVA